jgi:signal peptidase II
LDKGARLRQIGSRAEKPDGTDPNYIECDNAFGYTGLVVLMNALRRLLRTPNRRIALIACVIIGLDQFTKQLVLRFLGPVPFAHEKIIIPGFFRLVHWGNTGAAWSMFRGNNYALALVALVALAVLFFSRHHFDSATLLGQSAFGLIFGGIVGNLIDRLVWKHVIDFLYFYLQPAAGNEIGFPAFNVADSAICTGVGLVLLLTLRNERAAKHPAPAPEPGNPAPPVSP